MIVYWAKEMVSFVKYFLCNHKDLSLIPRSQIKKKKKAKLCGTYLLTRCWSRQRQKDPWDSLASEHGLADELQRKVDLSLSYTCMCTPTTQVHIHTHTSTQNDMIHTIQYLSEENWI